MTDNEKIDLVINTTKYGTIVKFSYMPDISASLKSFCRIYVGAENSSETTEQYPIEEIFIQTEGMNYEILVSDGEILDWLSKENIEYIEI